VFHRGRVQNGDQTLDLSFRAFEAFAVGSVDWLAEGQGLLASVSDADHNLVEVVTGIVNVLDVGILLVRKDDLWVNHGGSGGEMSSSGASDGQRVASDGKSSRDGGGDAE
jgi:hypothetical protein